MNKVKKMLRHILALILIFGGSYCIVKWYEFYKTEEPTVCATIDKTSLSAYFQSGKYASWKYMAKVTKPDGTQVWHEVNRAEIEAGQECYIQRADLTWQAIIGFICVVLLCFAIVVACAFWLFEIED